MRKRARTQQQDAGQAWNEPPFITVKRSFFHCGVIF